MKKKIIAGALVALMLLAALPFSALAAPGGSFAYTDVSNAWYTDAVAGYGYDDIFSDGSGLFKPAQQITRMEFARSLYKALGITINYFAAPDIADDFNDVKSTDPGAGALIDLVTAGIVEKGGSFNPNAPLNRDVMVHWIMNALEYKTDGNYVIPMVKPVPFSDDDKITDAYRNEIYSAVVLKLAFGKGGNVFDPKAGATRAEAVVVISRLMGLLDSYSEPDGQSVAVTAGAEEENGALVMRLTIANGTDKAVSISHGGQKFDFKLFNQKGETVYVWSQDKSFIMILDTTVIDPGQSVVYTATLDKDAYAAVKPDVAAMKAYITGTSDDFKIDEAGYTGTITAEKTN
ncbi:S-layer homology domain-containing protein [Sporobacter termitidis DSM 10068]|uniref:S-layer homology domain-containing protein n=1 Tax=Sporobacter termitidis DSM 10068 TaxID=1123282 RepID=A0A1M5X3K3_9FIRM|nr:S-layer homology domain-containing protein [Sporobacter termitidis]SHH94417.1 S-layer homology domain-containing protein [Sporobacter termitidis DSM 10068]